ncbi:MAG: RNA polymerase sigma factor [Acidobacteria bacterium]|nr:RNA polymerase sigma factor [Acidobacteriota bacterium]
MELSEILAALLEKNRFFYRRYCLKYIKKPDLVDDCLQSGFEKFLSCRRQFNSLQEAEKYLCRLLSNHFIDYLRRSMHRPLHLTAVTEKWDSTTPEELPEQQLASKQREIFRRQAVARICRGLEELPPHQREIVHLLFLREPPLSCREISRKKKIPITTVYSRFRSALRSLGSLCGDLAREWEKY